MKISEIMTANVHCTTPKSSLRDAAQQMSELDVGALPVCENDALVGMVTDRDIVVRSTKDGNPPDETRVGDVMTPKVVFCYEDDEIADAAELMEREQVWRLIVLNKDKRLAGIVSLGDLAVRSGDDQLSAEALERISEPALQA